MNYTSEQRQLITEAARNPTQYCVFECQTHEWLKAELRKARDAGAVDHAWMLRRAIDSQFNRRMLREARQQLRQQRLL